MKKIKFIFVGGKKLGYDALNYLLKKKIKPICVVPNIDDIGNDNVFCKSILNLSKKNKLKIIKKKKPTRFYFKRKNLRFNLVPRIYTYIAKRNYKYS